MLTELSSNLLNVKADLTKANNNIATINNKLISIVERGTKNNYNYTKYSNGDMVMWSKYTWNTNLATSWYNWYFASSAAVGFPVAFKEAPLIIVSPAKTNELYGLGVTEVTTTGYKLTAYSPKQGMCYVQADMLIIGKILLFAIIYESFFCHPYSLPGYINGSACAMSIPGLHHQQNIPLNQFPDYIRYISLAGIHKDSTVARYSL